MTGTSPTSGTPSGNLAGRAGLVTGAAGGIGRASAVRLAAEGAAVVVADLESERGRADETLALIRDAGGRAEFVACDVADSAQSAALVDRTLELYGRLDFAHNNAGVGGSRGRLADVSDEDFDRIIAVNLRGTFLGMKYQIRAMLAGGGGSIVNTSSNAGLRGVRQLSPYTASKHGIIGLTRNAAVEYADDAIRVNAVCPGAIVTPMMERSTPERALEIRKPQAMSRFGEASEVAAAVAWLCGPDSSFVTGVALPVDAGSVAGW